jgi:hypothetical protein
MMMGILSNSALNKPTANSIGLLSTEMIHPQINDPVIPEITQCITAIRKSIMDNNITKYEDLSKNSTIKLTYEKLDKIISKRFGIEFRHRFNVFTLYGIMAVTPYNASAIKEDVIDIYTNMKKRISYANTRYDEGDIMYSDDILIGMKRMLKNVDTLDKQLTESNIKIDLNGARIENLPNNFIVEIYCNPLMLFHKDVQLTDEEITAILLHEIGHQFTFIENSYRTVKNTTIFISTLQESINVKGKGFRESLILAYEKTNNTKLENTSKMSLNTVFLTITTKHIMDTFSLTDYESSNSDKEMLADQFAGRFGMQKILSSALYKVNQAHENDVFRYKIDIILPKILNASILILAILEIAAGTFGPMLITITVATILAFIAVNIAAYITYGGTNDGDDYDGLKKRISRIRTESIRILQSSNDKELTKKIIADIKDIDRLLDSIPDENVSLINKIYRIIRRSGARKFLEIGEIESLTEKLQSNDLYLASAKLKTL